MTLFWTLCFSAAIILGWCIGFAVYCAKEERRDRDDQ